MSTIPIDLENKILDLQEAVIKRLPQMPMLLQDIWTALKQQPENVTLLEEDQIQKIVAGLEIQTNTKLTEVMANKAKTGKVKVNLDDL